MKGSLGDSFSTEPFLHFALCKLSSFSLSTNLSFCFAVQDEPGLCLLFSSFALSFVISKTALELQLTKRCPALPQAKHLRVMQEVETLMPLQHEQLQFWKSRLIILRCHIFTCLHMSFFDRKVKFVCLTKHDGIIWENAGKNNMHMAAERE